MAPHVFNAVFTLILEEHTIWALDCHSRLPQNYSSPCCHCHPSLQTYLLTPNGKIAPSANRCLHGSSSAAVVGAYWCGVVYHSPTCIQCRIHVDIRRTYDLGRLIVTHGYHKNYSSPIATAIRHFKRIGAPPNGKVAPSAKPAVCMVVAPPQLSVPIGVV